MFFRRRIVNENSKVRQFQQIVFILIIIIIITDTYTKIIELLYHNILNYCIYLVKNLLRIFFLYNLNFIDFV